MMDLAVWCMEIGDIEALRYGQMDDVMTLNVVNVSTVAVMTMMAMNIIAIGASMAQR